METASLTHEGSIEDLEPPELTWQRQAAAAFAIEHSNSPHAEAARNFFKRDELPREVQELLDAYDQTLV